MQITPHWSEWEWFTASPEVRDDGGPPNPNSAFWCGENKTCYWIEDIVIHGYYFYLVPYRVPGSPPHARKLSHLTQSWSHYAVTRGSDPFYLLWRTIGNYKNLYNQLLDTSQLSLLRLELTSYPSPPSQLPGPVSWWRDLFAMMHSLFSRSYSLLWGN